MNGTVPIDRTAKRGFGHLVTGKDPSPDTLEVVAKYEDHGKPRVTGLDWDAHRAPDAAPALQPLPGLAKQPGTPLGDPAVPERFQSPPVAASVVDPPPVERDDPQLLAVIRSLYRQGKTQRQIAAAVHVSQNKVSILMRRNGMETRPSGRRKLTWETAARDPETGLPPAWALREWAAEQGVECGKLARIPEAVKTAFRVATGALPPVPPAPDPEPAVAPAIPAQRAPEPERTRTLTIAMTNEQWEEAWDRLDSIAGGFLFLSDLVAQLAYDHAGINVSDR